jgi:hypothetical protein
MMFSHRGRSYSSNLIWEEGKTLLRDKICPQDLQDDLLDKLYILQQSDLYVTDFARRYKELFL